MSAVAPDFFVKWMDDHRLAAADVAEGLGVSENTIYNWRSSGVPTSRVPHVEKFIEDWMGFHVGANIPDELLWQMNLAAQKDGATLDEWSNSALEGLAAEWIQTGEIPQ